MNPAEVTDPTGKPQKVHSHHRHKQQQEEDEQTIPNNVAMIPTNTAAMPNNYNLPARATTEKIPTTTVGPFSIVVVVFLVILTCLILNCNRIRQRVEVRRSATPIEKKEEEKDLEIAIPESSYHSTASTMKSTYKQKQQDFIKHPEYNININNMENSAVSTLSSHHHHHPQQQPINYDNRFYPVHFNS